MSVALIQQYLKSIIIITNNFVNQNVNDVFLVELFICFVLKATGHCVLTKYIQGNLIIKCSKNNVFITWNMVHLGWRAE